MSLAYQVLARRGDRLKRFWFGSHVNSSISTNACGAEEPTGRRGLRRFRHDQVPVRAMRSGLVVVKSTNGDEMTFGSLEMSDQPQMTQADLKARRDGQCPRTGHA